MLTGFVIFCCYMYEQTKIKLKLKLPLRINSVMLWIFCSQLSCITLTDDRRSERWTLGRSIYRTRIESRDKNCIHSYPCRMLAAIHIWSLLWLYAANTSTHARNWIKHENSKISRATIETEEAPYLCPYTPSAAGQFNLYAGFVNIIRNFYSVRI